MINFDQYFLKNSNFEFDFFFNSEEIVGRQNQLNQRWGDLRERSEAKREELASAHGVQTFHIECRETVTWIEDKMRVLEQTDELKMDLTGIMTLQRKLTGMYYLRSLNSIDSKNCFIVPNFNYSTFIKNSTFKR